MYSYETNGRGNTSATDAKLLERKSQFINLPAVTPEDNGKVLGVDKGKWQPIAGGWPADLPKPSVGGYGYTESGEQTTITWDGDTEGREAIYIEEDGERIDLNYKVSDLTFTADSVLGGKMTFNNVEYDISDINIVNNDSDGYTSSTAEFTAVVLETFAVISCSASGVIRFTEDGETFEYHCPDTGIYFVNAGGNYFVSSLTYGTPETVHKIDEKYLPASGGAMVVNFSTGDDGYTADKTPQEIVSAFHSGTFVYGVLTGVQPLTLTIAFGGGEDEYNIQFDSLGVVPEIGAIIVHVEWDGDDEVWTPSQMILRNN